MSKIIAAIVLAVTLTGAMASTADAQPYGYRHHHGYHHHWRHWHRHGWHRYGGWHRHWRP